MKRNIIHKHTLLSGRSSCGSSESGGCPIPIRCCLSNNSVVPICPTACRQHFVVVLFFSL